MRVSRSHRRLLGLVVGTAVMLGLAVPLVGGPAGSGTTLAAPGYQTAPPPGGPPGLQSGGPGVAPVIAPPPGTTVLSTTNLPPAAPGVFSAEIPAGGADSVGVVNSGLPGDGEVTAIVPAGAAPVRVDVGPAPPGQVIGGDPNAVMSITLDLVDATTGQNVTEAVQVGIDPGNNVNIPPGATAVVVNVCNAQGQCTPVTFTVDRTNPGRPVLRAQVNA